MAIYYGTVDNSLGTSANTKLVTKLKEAAELEGWSTLDYDISTINPRWAGRSGGLSGTEEINVGIEGFQVSGDLSCKLWAYPFWVNGLNATQQSNRLGSENEPTNGYLPLSLGEVTTEYYFFINEQRIIVMTVRLNTIVKVGMVGKFFPYARPDQYANPLICWQTEYDNYEFAMDNIPCSGPALTSLSGVRMTYPQPSGGGSQMWPETKLFRNTVHIIPCQIFKENVNTITPFTGELLGEPDGLAYAFSNGIQNMGVLQVGGSSYVDLTGLSIVGAIAAINAVGGVAYISLFNGSQLGSKIAICVKGE